VLNFGFNFAGRRIISGGGRQLPCMTSYDQPYGKVTSSSELLPGNEAWKAFSEDLSEHWLTEIIDNANIPYDPNLDVHGHYVEWRLSDEDLATYPYFAPQWIILTPPKNQTEQWYKDNNPKTIKIFGELSDGSAYLMKVWVFDSWDNSESKTVTINFQEKVRSIRIYISSTNLSNNGGSYQSGFSCVRTYYSLIDLPHPLQIVHDGIYIEHDGVDVLHTNPITKGNKDA
jgi:hypothetical protein